MLEKRGFPQSSTFVDNLARRMAADITRNATREARPLPSIRDLARHYGVSYVTMWRATGVLRANGMIVRAQGRRMRTVSGDPGSVAPEKLPALDRAYGAIRSRIADGTYRCGSALPKRVLLAGETGVSIPTVSSALRRLESDCVIYKQGRAWIVGKRQSSVRVGVGPVRVIVLVQHDVDHWRSLCQSQRIGMFGQIFKQEAQTHGVRIMPVLSIPRQPHGEWYAEGWDEVCKEIARQKSSYLGALIVSARHEEPSLGHWITGLLKFQRPVVWFDRFDEGAPLDTQASPDGMARAARISGARSRRKLFTRCHPSESAVASCAVRALHSLGHRRVGYSTPYLEDWARRRGDLLLQWAARLDPPLRIVRYPDTETLMREIDASPRRREWLRASVSRLLAKRTLLSRCLSEYLRVAERMDGEMREYLAEARGGDMIDRVLAIMRCHVFGGRAIPAAYPAYSLHTRLARYTPAMLPFVQMKGLSALLSRYDRDARSELAWLRAAGIGVPKTISLLSFDNSSFAEDSSLSSVDFGFGTLGYAAFHAIVDDIPVNRDRSGAIAVQPQVVHRGSLGPAPGVSHS